MFWSRLSFWIPCIWESNYVCRARFRFDAWILRRDLVKFPSSHMCILYLYKNIWYELMNAFLLCSLNVIFCMHSLTYEYKSKTLLHSKVHKKMYLSQWSLQVYSLLLNAPNVNVTTWTSWTSHGKFSLFSCGPAFDKLLKNPYVTPICWQLPWKSVHNY